MAQLTAVAGMLELFAIAAGLVLLHRASKEAPAQLLEAAGWALLAGGIVAGGILVGTRTTLYWFEHQSRGELDTVHMGYPETTTAPQTRMGPGALVPGMTGPGMGSMPYGVTPSPAPADGAR